MERPVVNGWRREISILFLLSASDAVANRPQISSLCLFLASNARTSILDNDRAMTEALRRHHGRCSRKCCQVELILLSSTALWPCVSSSTALWSCVAMLFCKWTISMIQRPLHIFICCVMIRSSSLLTWGPFLSGPLLLVKLSCLNKYAMNMSLSLRYLLQTVEWFWQSCKKRWGL